MASGKETFDIAIIGGGLVGTSLACILSVSQPWLKIALLELNPLATDAVPHYASNFDARSTALSYGSAQILQQAGLWPVLCEHVTPIQRVHVSDRGHFNGSMIDAAEQQISALGYVVENAWLGRVLSAFLQQQKNITSFAPARVTSVVPQAVGTTLNVEAEGARFQLVCQLAVVADGGDSPMRQQLGIHTRVTDYRQSAIIANVSFSQPHQCVAYERFTADGPMALLPLGEAASARRAALVWTLPKPLAARQIMVDDKTFLTDLQEQFGLRVGRFERVGRRQLYPLQLVVAEEQIRSGVALVGNAAHYLHPVAGQGFNLALRDCVCLAEVLLEAHIQQRQLGDLQTLQIYLERQRQDQLLTIQFSDKLVRLFSSSELPLIALRHLGFISLSMLPPLKRVLTTRAMGIAERSPRWQAVNSSRSSP